MTFIPDTATLVSFSIASFVLFITPGPDMSLFLARTISGGRRLGFASVLGANIGCCIHTLAAAFGLSALLAASATAFTVLKVIGALYLVWLAIDAIRNGSSLNVRADTAPPRTVLRTMFAGIAVNLTNPKIVLFFVTFLPLFVAVSDPNAPGKLFFLGLYFIAFNLPLSVMLILGAERLVGYLKTRPYVLRFIDWLFAGVFGFFAVQILRTQGR